MRLGFLLSFIALAAGCASLPDIKPFAHATGNLATAVSSAGLTTEQAIASTFDPTVPETKPQARQRAEDFRKVWQHRANVVNAFSEYVDGLAAVVEAGNDGEAAGKQVTGQFIHLLESVKPGFGIEPAASAVAEVAATIYGEYTRHRAARALSEAVTRNQPYVRELTVALNKDWDLVKELVDSSFDQMITVELAETDSDRAALAAIAKQLPEGQRFVIKTLENPVGPEEEAAKFAATKAKLTELDALRTRIVSNPIYQQHMKNLETLQTESAQLLTFIDHAKLVTVHWATAHEELAIALQERRPVSFRRLLHVSEELLRIQQKARER